VRFWFWKWVYMLTGDLRAKVRFIEAWERDTNRSEKDAGTVWNLGGGK
jgi:hypothetical protein